MPKRKVPAHIQEQIKRRGPGADISDLTQRLANMRRHQRQLETETFRDNPLQPILKGLRKRRK